MAQTSFDSLIELLYDRDLETSMLLALMKTCIDKKTYNDPKDLHDLHEHLMPLAKKIAANANDNMKNKTKDKKTESPIPHFGDYGLPIKSTEI